MINCVIMGIPHGTEVVLCGSPVQPGVDNCLVGEDVPAEMNQAAGMREEGGSEVSQLRGLHYQPAWSWANKKFTYIYKLIIIILLWPYFIHYYTHVYVRGSSRVSPFARVRPSPLMSISRAATSCGSSGPSRTTQWFTSSSSTDTRAYHAACEHNITCTYYMKFKGLRSTCMYVYYGSQAQVKIDDIISDTMCRCTSSL